MDSIIDDIMLSICVNPFPHETASVVARGLKEVYTGIEKKSKSVILAVRVMPKRAKLETNLSYKLTEDVDRQLLEKES